LCDCRQRELELCAAGATKAQSVKPQNALEVRKQHLDLLAIAAHCANAAVLARARATSRAASFTSRLIRRAGMFAQHFALTGRRDTQARSV
jgi:hypothetical protein